MAPNAESNPNRTLVRAQRWWRTSLAQVRCKAMVGVTLVLCLVDPGSIDLRAVAQETAGQSRSQLAASATVLTVEQEKELAAEAGSAFKECASGCPVMIVIPAGKFTMGSPDNEPDREASEGPQHEVTLADPFAVSKFEVSFEEWDACVAAGNARTLPPLGDGARCRWSTSAGAMPTNMWLGSPRSPGSSTDF
jgi:formylglycine-generating enzyme required for sulfatase activity